LLLPIDGVDRWGQITLISKSLAPKFRKQDIDGFANKLIVGKADAFALPSHLCSPIIW
jgi:hypothetical protein